MAQVATHPVSATVAAPVQKLRVKPRRMLTLLCRVRRSELPPADGCRSNETALFLPTPVCLTGFPLGKQVVETDLGPGFELISLEYQF